MKKIKIKRLTFSNSNEYLIGSTEYDGRLSNSNILNSFHELGKTEIHGFGLFLLKDGVPRYLVRVETFYRYEKSWYNYLWDWIRRH